ncbi:DUF2231 domain-containing protein [Bdellovibrio sp. BCCA]|uniref:DUF2231 domain-containing protein n=1 Tax=Bdellovibrio sp. BCCA TaxID=3136281 RepID=UPI0030EFC198
MYSKASIKGHPIHPMLVAFPITLYLVTFIAFAVYYYTSADIFWFKLGYFSNMAAVGLAVLAAIPGFIDWALGIPNKTEAKTDGLIHMSLNLITLALFAVNASMISGTWNEPPVNLGVTLILTGIGSLTLLGAGFYGWKMIGVHKVGVLMSAEQEEIQERYERKRPHEEPPVIFH